MRAVNLLPREVTRARRWPAAIVQLAIVSPFVVGSLLAAGYLLASSQVNDRKATLQALQDELTTLPAPTTEEQPNAALAAQRDLRVNALSGALQGRLAWDRLLRDVSAVLPKDVWLTALSAQAPVSPAATPDGATPATPAPAPTTPLSITGYTYSQEAVARLLTRLAVVPELQNVTLRQSTQTAVMGRDVFSFSIEAGVKAQVTG
jgi:Tfp pilus assembly protein PilN